MHYILAWPLYFYSGLCGIWDIIVLIPHPSWHKLVEAFITGLIIKAGYFSGHMAVRRLEVIRPKHRKPKDVATVSGVSEYLES